MMHLPRSVRDAAVGGAIGAGFGAALVAGVAARLDGGEAMLASQDALPWLTLIVLVIVAQFAVAGGLFVFAVRQFGASNFSPSSHRALPSGAKRPIAR